MYSWFLSLVGATSFAVAMNWLTILVSPIIIDALKIKRFRPLEDEPSASSQYTAIQPPQSATAASTAASGAAEELPTGIIVEKFAEKSTLSAQQLTSRFPSHSSRSKEVTPQVVALIIFNMFIPQILFGLWFATCTTDDSWKIDSYASTFKSMLQVPFLLILTDCMYYPYHWAVHSFPSLRFIHTMHHELHECEYVLWSYYAHPIDFFCGSLVTVLPCCVAANGYVALVYMTIEGIVGLLNHHGAAIKIPFVFEAQFHDDHHRFFHCNYSLNFKVFDKVFNTYRAPSPIQ